MTIPKGTRLGPYEIEGQIGAGGTGAVYLAVDSRLERKVAIKILPDMFASNPQFLGRFEREAKTISSLSHPNICVLHAVRVTTSKESIELGVPERISLSDANLGPPVGGDGERFIMIKPVGGDIPNPVFVPRDWTLGLK